MKRLDYDINVDCLEINIEAFAQELNDMGEQFTVDIDPFCSGCFTIRKPKQTTVDYINTLSEEGIEIIS